MTGPNVFLAMPDACGLRPCDRTHLKNGLVPDLYVAGTYDKYPGVTGSVLIFCLPAGSQTFLSASRMLAGTTEPVNFLILIYSARWCSNFYSLKLLGGRNLLKGPI